jgi:hypothetical protein
MSALMTFQPRREMMDIGQDTNGDGIPDGAEVTVRRTATDPIAGHTTVTSARYTKKPATRERFPVEPGAGTNTGTDSGATSARYTNKAAVTERFPVESFPAESPADLPPAQAPLPPNQQMPNESATPATGNQWDQFTRRTDRAYDSMIGGTRSNTDVNPVAKEDERRRLVRASEDLSIAPFKRAKASERLAMMDTTAGRSADLANSERRTLITAHGQRAKADAVIEGKKIMADAMVNQTEASANGKKDVAQINKDKEAEKQREITEREITVKTLLKNGDVEIANSIALAGLSKEKLRSETDRVVAELHRQGEIGKAKALAGLRDFIDPRVYESSNPAQRDRLISMAEKAKAAQADSVTPPNTDGLLAVKTQSSDMVRMRSPKGTERMVPRSQVEKYRGLGAEEVK